MKKTNKILSILLLIIILFSNFSNIFAKTISENSKINLKFDHDCVSVLKIKGKDQLKQVAYVCYIDPDTGISYPAFCVEPANIGVGTGAGDNYDVTISSLNNPILWRMLYKGYVGSSYTSWGLDSDDDLYFATKTAVHCFADGSTPKEKYEIPHRVGRGDNATLEEVQSRGAKVLEVAQAIYDYGYKSSENYMKATASISKGNSSEQTLNGTKYLVQNYSLITNKELSSYKVSISKFPTGTKILNSSNIEATKMQASTFKIAIPEKSLTENFKGTINVNNAEIKSFPIFYCDSGNLSTQDYIISGKSEEVNAQTTLNVDVYKSTLKIIKSDEESKPVAGAVFNLKYSDGTNIGDYTTDSNGTITVSKLKQGSILATEKSVPSSYVLDSSSKNIILEYNSTKTLNVANKLKRGNLKIIKIDEDNKEIRIPNVEIQLLDSNKKAIGTYKTDKNGEISINNLKIGDYYLREVKENSSYYPLKEDMKVTIKHNELTTKVIKNEKLKGQIEVYKIDSENKNYKLENVIFEVLDSNKKIVETITTNKDGYAKTKRLPIGTYYLKEIKTQNRYLLKQDLIKVEVKQDEVTSKIITNDKKKEGNLIVYKVDKDNSKIGIEGIKFDLYSMELGKVIGSYTTDINGKIQIENLKVGEYKLIEKVTNEWYNIAEDVTIKIDRDITTKVTIENELKKGQVRVIKVDSENNNIKLKGVKFEVLDENDNILEEIITNEKGEAITSKYPLRDFQELKIREKETLENYALSDEVKTIKLEEKQIKDIIFQNQKIKGKIKILKLSEDDSLINGTPKGTPIKDVIFEIRDKDGKVVQLLTTNEEGIAISKELEKGTYTIKEIETNQDYEITDEEFTIEIIEHKKIEELTITNKPKVPKLPRTGF